MKKRIVVKVGTSTITNNDGDIDIRTIELLTRTLAAMESMGYEIILVSSGAIAVGARKMRLDKRPEDLRLKQAAAAVGQCELMHLYDKLFGEYGRITGQILLSHEDIEDPVRRENLSGTIETLVTHKIIPIINENDSVNYNEIESKEKRFSDNDMLSALVAAFVNASKLIILTDTEGLYDADPSKNPDAKLISRVEVIDDRIRALAEGSSSNRGTGGMITKIDAAAYATARGIDVLIAYGRDTENLYRVIDREIVGTLFVARE